MIKRMFLLLLITGLAGLIIEVSRAYFSDQVTSTNNTFQAGTLDLKLSDSDEEDSDSVSFTWSGDNLAPGDSVSGNLWIKNSGTVAGNHIEITFSNTVTEASSGVGTTDTIPLDTVLEVVSLQYDADGDGTAERNLLEEVDLDSNGNNNGIIDLDDLENYTFDNLPLTDLNTNHLLTMTVRFHPNLAANEHQGDSLETTVTITLNQDASQ